MKNFQERYRYTRTVRDGKQVGLDDDQEVGMEDVLTTRSVGAPTQPSAIPYGRAQTVMPDCSRVMQFGERLDPG